jgi:hypothetical protein
MHRLAGCGSAPARLSEADETAIRTANQRYIEAREQIARWGSRSSNFAEDAANRAAVATAGGMSWYLLQRLTAPQVGNEPRFHKRT